VSLRSGVSYGPDKPFLLHIGGREGRPIWSWPIQHVQLAEKNPDGLEKITDGFFRQPIAEHTPNRLRQPSSPDCQKTDNPVYVSGLLMKEGLKENFMASDLQELMQNSLKG
jgi:hypothetical protein